LLGKTAFASPVRPSRPPAGQARIRPLASHYRDPADFHCETRIIATLGGRNLVAKDTKPKGFSP
jgi:hypothetical protein